MKLDKLWLELEEWEKDVLLYLVRGVSPVTIDILCILSPQSPAGILNLMDKLKKKKILCEKKECPKGTFFICDSDMENRIRDYVSAAKMRKIVKAMISAYCQYLDEGDDKTLALAKFYIEMGEHGEGPEYVMAAADKLMNMDRTDEACSYYDYLLHSFTKDNLDQSNARYYLGGFMGKIQIVGQWIPVSEIVPQLVEARDIAQKFKCWKILEKIQFELIWRLLLKEEDKVAERYISATRKLAMKLSNGPMLQMAAMWQSEICRWRGEFAEGNRRYEESVGKLETFGDDKPSLWAGAGRGLSYVIAGRVAQGLGMIEAVRLKTSLLNIMSHRLEVFVDRMLVMSLLEIRNFNEAEKYIRKLFALPDELLGHYMLRELYLYQACLHCARGEYQQAFENHCKAAGYARYGGYVQQKFPWSFEYMNALEKQELIHEEMNYDGEIERVLKGNDIYMKGVGLRYRALRNLDRQQPCEKILPDLLKSEKLLEQAGAEIELARTWVALGRASLNQDDKNSAQTYLEKAWIVFSKIDKELFPKDLFSILPLEKRNEVVIGRIITINESLGNIRDNTVFINQVISAALDFTMATRGAFFSIEVDHEPRIVASKNIDPLFFETAQFKFITELVSQAARNKSERIAPGSGDENDEALVLNGITSFICMPTKQSDTSLGYLYLDNRFGGGRFHEQQLVYLRLLCSQMAVGISSIAAYEAVREMKERYHDEADFYKREMGIVNPIEAIIGSSTGITAIKEAIRQVAPTDSTALIMGETGVGKELVAKAIHNLSNRKNGPFIPVNLAAIPPELFVSELFGHEKGAFTGAGELYKGRFELAHGGTIFLDEIGDLPLHVQVRLLRVLQEGSLERLGSSKSIRSDFRVIAATNKDLAREVEKGTFRQDLYYRLNVFPLFVPPLRERSGDIRSLAQHFLIKTARKMGKKPGHISAEELKKLANYSWPGNVRELKHAVDRAVILSDGGKIRFSWIEPTAADSLPGGDSFLASLQDIEREHIEKVLNATRWKVTGPKGAALILGLKPTTLFARMKKLGINRGL